MDKAKVQLEVPDAMCRRQQWSPETNSPAIRPPRPVTGCQRCCRCFWNTCKRYLLPITLFLLLSFGGAFMFERIEGQNERDAIIRQKQLRQSMLQKLWNESQTTDNSKQWQVLASELILEYEYIRVNDLQPVFPVNGELEDQMWSFWGALLYCGTIYTTIGYGLICPKTVAGRAATIGYAFVGIPVCMILLNNLGKLMALALRKLHWLIWRIFHYATKAGTMAGQAAGKAAGQARGQVTSLLNKQSRSKEDLPNDDTDMSAQPEDSDITKTVESSPELTHARSSFDSTDLEPEGESGGVDEDLASEEQFSPSPLFPTAVLILYIFAGAWMYSSWETWDYFESAYFIFVSLSTIGLGDVTPSHPKFFMASSIYILFGLTLVSFVINTVLLQAQKTLKKAQQAPGKIIAIGKRYKDTAKDKLARTSISKSDSYIVAV